MTAAIIRRDVIIILTSVAAALAITLASSAQEPGRIYRIGFLTGGPPEALHIIAFFNGLRMCILVDAS
jgi:hypothetical protein